MVSCHFLVSCHEIMYNYIGNLFIVCKWLVAGVIFFPSKSRITSRVLPYVICQDKKKTVPVKPAEMNRTRRDRGELEDIMLKQLVQETDQPAQFLKEILNELCVYNKWGTNQGTYELKPEYKKAVDDTGGWVTHLLSLCNTLYHRANSVPKAFQVNLLVVPDFTVVHDIWPLFMI